MQTFEFSLEVWHLGSATDVSTCGSSANKNGSVRLCVD